MAISDPDSKSMLSIMTTEIDPISYPSLDIYMRSGFKPGPAAGWKDWRIVSTATVREDATVQAQSFVYEYAEAAGGLKTGEEHWYVLGQHVVKVKVIMDRDLWRDSLAWSAIAEMQRSFSPASYTDTQFGYSVAYPTFWIEDSSISYDYWATDPASTRNLFVQVFLAWNYTSVVDYGNVNTVYGSDIRSRKQVYAKRANPSYRIDYTRPAKGAETRKKGAVLITLGGGNAVWVFVQADHDDWERLKPLVELIFLRVAVRP